MRVDWGGNVDGGWGPLLFQFFRLLIQFLICEVTKGILMVFFSFRVSSFVHTSIWFHYCSSDTGEFHYSCAYQPFFLSLAKTNIFLVLDVLRLSLCFLLCVLYFLCNFLFVCVFMFVSFFSFSHHAFIFLSLIYIVLFHLCPIYFDFFFMFTFTCAAAAFDFSFLF